MGPRKRTEHGNQKPHWPLWFKDTRPIIKDEKIENSIV